LACGRTVCAAGLPPDETVKLLKPAEGLEAKLVASEPQVRQPVCVTFDARGRMWAVQYIQYPHPAGMKPIRVDPWLRTQFDHEPMPPPNGDIGADKITIFDDPDENGRYRKSKDFLTGLNIATSVEFGYGGVWVLNPPYLLFYPDRNGDDVPDGPPEVKLSGFGLEDTHAIANHLTWGPDGWLYGAQGSTCTADIRGNEFQQAAWRYHPITKKFEVFSEGGGNTFGLEWDEHGNLLTGTNHAHYVMVHYVEGGYFIKTWAKHGALHNPYAYGFIDHVPHTNFRGGHVTQLGVMYQGGALPERFNGKWIAPNILANVVDFHTITPDGATFTSAYAGEFLGSGDACFRPVDIKTGPDGAIYIADWYDRRANHVIPEDNWDKDTGRVYRVSTKGAPGYKPFDLTKKSSAELIELLSNPNDWYARMARHLLAERHDASVAPALKKMVHDNDGRLALEALWALYVSDGLDDTTAVELLGHRNPDVRAWTARLLCDENQIAPSLRQPLVELAKSEKDPTVRSQLACSARRLPAADGLPIARELMLHAEDVKDRYIPLLIWWAVEPKVTEDVGQVLATFNSPAVWNAELVQTHLLERLGRRLTAEQKPAHLDACAKLLDTAPGAAQLDRLMAGMETGLQSGTGRMPATPPAVGQSLTRLWAHGSPSPLLVRLSLRLAWPAAQDQAVRLVADSHTPAADRAELIRALGDAGDSSSLQVLLDRLKPSEPKDVRIAALSALQRFDDPRVAVAVLNVFPGLPNSARPPAAALLVSRPAWAKALVTAVAAGSIKPDLIPAEQVRRLLVYKDDALTTAVGKFWGSVRPATDQEKADSTARAKKALSEGPGVASRGQEVFTKVCGQCHTFDGKGARTAPDLTGFGKGNFDYMIYNIVDPSAVIRDEYATFIVKTTDGEILNGAINETEATVTVDDGQTKTAVPRNRVASVEVSSVSRMPEKLLEAMTPDQIRDLFAYLTSESKGK
jgi:putative membrane-bound dehydrogenase-like protein